MPEAELLARSGNVAILQIPRRQFPAIAIQGDTFWCLVSCARAALAHCLDTKTREDLEDMLQVAEEAIALYRRVLRERGMDTPWGGAP